MKRIFLVIFICAAIQSNILAQSEEVQQLILNVEKLAQFKRILSDMKKGYQILNAGYSSIRHISKGNFNLHKTFLDGLLGVNPAVRNSRKVSQIINDQLLIVNEYKNAFNRFRQDKNFNPGEIEYMSKVYANLFKQGIKNLDELSTIITANKLRMSDEERLAAIDRIYLDMQGKLMFLRQFNTNTSILALQRARERNDVLTIRSIYGLTN